MLLGDHCRDCKTFEAFPTSRADAGAVANALVREIIPRWLNHDNVSHFVSNAVKEVASKG